MSAPGFFHAKAWRGEGSGVPLVHVTPNSILLENIFEATWGQSPPPYSLIKIFLKKKTPLSTSLPGPSGRSRSEGGGRLSKTSNSVAKRPGPLHTGRHCSPRGNPINGVEVSGGQETRSIRRCDVRGDTFCEGRSAKGPAPLMIPRGNPEKRVLNTKNQLEGFKGSATLISECRDLLGENAVRPQGPLGRPTIYLSTPISGSGEIFPGNSR